MGCWQSKLTPHNELVPIVLVSSVTGQGLDLLNEFLFRLPSPDSAPGTPRYRATPSADNVNVVTTSGGSDGGGGGGSGGAGAGGSGGVRLNMTTTTLYSAAPCSASLDDFGDFSEPPHLSLGGCDLSLGECDGMVTE